MSDEDSHVENTNNCKDDNVVEKLNDNKNLEDVKKDSIECFSPPTISTLVPELISMGLLKLSKQEKNEPMKKRHFIMPIENLWKIELKKLNSKPKIKNLVKIFKDKIVLSMLETTTSEQYQKFSEKDEEVLDECVKELCEITQELFDSLDEEEYLHNKFYTLPLNPLKNPLKIQNHTNFQILNDENKQDYNDENDLNINSNNVENNHRIENFNSHSFDNQIDAQNLEQYNPINSRIDHHTIINENSNNQNSDEVHDYNEEYQMGRLNEERSTERRSLLEEKTIMNQLEAQSINPINNGEISFNKHYSIIVGNFDSKLLREKNILKCKVMKKSDLRVNMSRENQRTKKNYEKK
jgi:hypothetical protein